MPWPTPANPADPEPPFAADLHYNDVRAFLPGLTLAMYSAFHRPNAWGRHLLAVLPDERLGALRQVLAAFEAVPLEQPLVLRLHLPDAAVLHLAAHVGALTTIHDVWDDILAHLRRQAVRRDPTVVPTFGLPPADPTARGMRQEVALVSGELARYIEEVFGEDTPALVTNRQLVSQLLDE